MIDVVVPVYEHYEVTRGCLEHLARQSVPHRTIVVDDDSPDDSAAHLRAEWPAVALITLDENRGYSHAVNRGVAAGAGEYVVVLNNDVELRPDCLERLVAPLQHDPRVGSVAALMLSPGERTIDSFGITVDPTLAPFARMHGQSATLDGQGAPGDTAERTRVRRSPCESPVLAGPDGNAAAYRRAAWEQVGGFDETFTVYGVTADLALRLRSAGWRAAQASAAVGVHLGSVTYGRSSARQRRLVGFGRAYLLRRYRVLHRSVAPRTLATEALVVVADALVYRDLAALRGRVAGWRAAHMQAERPWPPSNAIDHAISLRRSLVLRWRVFRT